MECNSCKDEIALGQIVFQSHDGMIACCAECSLNLDAGREQQDALPEWKQYLVRERTTE